MAEKPIQHNDSTAAVRIKRTEAYAEQVRKAFAATVNSILDLNKSMPKLDDGVMYSFDGDTLAKQKKVEELLRRLHSVVTFAIERGIQLEWGQASEETDKLVKSVFGKKILSTPEFKAWNERNTEAMNAFIQRSEKGLNLSQRVWKTVEQLRDEMEVAITVSIGEGQSASQMSKKVRQYLNEPDLMFRRFRYKAGEKTVDDYDENGNKVGSHKEPVYGKKWKKRVKGKDGKVHFIDYDKDDYKTGRGVYKSSAKNAMRVCRTETNIAYRRSDNQRWSDLDFVVGQHIALSRSHPKKDICDKLAGDYPKDFKFDGWHPQCFCVCTPITVPIEQTKHLTKMFMEGKDWKSELKRIARGYEVKDYPQGFKDWVTENKDKIALSQERGTEPYFVKNNASVIDEIINPKPISETIKKAQLRHEQRTPEQIEDIKNRWQQHEHKQAILNAAKVRHDNRTPEQVEAIQKAWDERKKKIAQTINVAKNTLNVACNWKEVDYSALQNAIDNNDLQMMKQEAKNVAQSIYKVKQQEKALETVIPDVHQWHNLYSLQELQQVYDAVKKKIDYIETKPLNSYKYSNVLEQQKHLLSDEIKYVEDPTYLKPHTQYPTWKVSQSAYAKKLKEVTYKIDVKEQTDKLQAIKDWLATHTKSAKVAGLVADADLAITNKASIAEIQGKVAAAETEYNKRLAEAKRRAKKKGIGSTVSLEKSSLDENQLFDVGKKMGDKPNAAWDADTVKELKEAIKANDKDAVKEAIKKIGIDLTDSFNQYRKDAAVWNIDAQDADDYFHQNAVELWKQLTDKEKTALWGYTGGSAYITEPLRAIQGHYYYYTSKKAQIQRDIDAMTTALSKQKLKNDVWIKRDSDPWNINYIFGIELDKFKSDASKLVGKVGIEDSFQSCGSCKNTRFTCTGPKQVVMNIYCPKGTYASYAEPWSSCGAYGKSWDGKKKANPSNRSENEVILQRGAKMKITKAEYNSSENMWYIDVEVEGFNIRDFDLMEEPDGIYCKFK